MQGLFDHLTIFHFYFNELFSKNIYDEENIPDTIQIQDDCINLDDDMEDNLQGNLNLLFKIKIIKSCI